LLLLLLPPPLDTNDSSSSSSLITRAVLASQLHDTPRELSRILIVLVTNNNNQPYHHQDSSSRILGWVSNFGDAASRAWDISFATGHKKKKEFVPLVHASVIGPDTLTTIVSGSSTCCSTQNMIIRLC
jgi:hypothetical protein